MNEWKGFNASLAMLAMGAALGACDAPMGEEANASPPASDPRADARLDRGNVDPSPARPRSPSGLDASTPPPHGLSPTFVPFDINHVLSTGQSLSVGAMGTPPLSLSQPFDNLMFTSGVLAEFAEDFMPLVEGDTEDVETMSSGFANHVAGEAKEDPSLGIHHTLLMSVHGLGSTDYAGLKKGTGAYERGMEQTRGGYTRAKQLGKSYVVRAVTVVHGESDHYEGNTHYADDVIEWQRDYESDVRAITGQTLPVPLMHTQVSAITSSIIPQAQLEAHLRAPGKVVLVGPKYHLPYADGLHLTAEGYRHMGEDYAKVYRRIILEERPWEPLRPRSLVRVGDTITVTFHVPSPPLVFDTKLVADPGGLGFELKGGQGPLPAIVEVTTIAPDQVRIKLSAVPPQGARLAYAQHYGAPRGNLRDSDPTPSRYGYLLYNWCVHFEESIP